MYIIKEENNVVITEDVKGYLDRVKRGVTCDVTIPDIETEIVVNAIKQGKVNWETIFRELDKEKTEEVLKIACGVIAARDGLMVSGEEVAAFYKKIAQPVAPLEIPTDDTQLPLGTEGPYEFDYFTEKGFDTALPHESAASMFENDFLFMDTPSDLFVTGAPKELDPSYPSLFDEEDEEEDFEDEDFDEEDFEDEEDYFLDLEDDDEDFFGSDEIKKCDAKVAELESKIAERDTLQEKEGADTEQGESFGNSDSIPDTEIDTVIELNLTTPKESNIETNKDNKVSDCEDTVPCNDDLDSFDDVLETAFGNMVSENSTIEVEEGNKTDLQAELFEILDKQVSELESRLSLALATDIDHFLVLLSTLVYTLTSKNIPVFSSSSTSVSVIRSLKHYLEDQMQILDGEVEAYKGIKAKPFVICHYKNLKREVLAVGNQEDVNVLYFYLEAKLTLDRFVYNAKNNIVWQAKKESQNVEKTTLEIQVLHALVDYVREIYVDELLPTLEEESEKEKHAILYTDASVLNGNPDITGGVSVVLRVDNKLYEYGAALSHFRSELRNINFYELSAIALGVRLAVEYHGCNSVEVFTDSQNALNMLENNKLDNLRVQTLKSNYLTNIYSVCPDLNITYSHVKAHNKDFWNNRADSFARVARESNVYLNAHAIFREAITDSMVTKLHL